jgi:S-adenosylmethionine hydrolase
MIELPFTANGIITLTTDFGLSDPYAGIMKGVMLARHPLARLVDLTHQVPVFQPRLAGFWLARAWRYFPAGTVHLAVVDPGVGTERAMILMEAAGQVFVAPDNGLLNEVARLAPSGQWRSFTLSDLAHLQLPAPSQTFNGRDIFAPLVAEISANRFPPNQLGQLSDPPLRQVTTSREAGHIIAIDHFGNLITDIDAEHLQQFARPAIQFRGRLIPLHPTYGRAQAGQLLAVVNSWGTLEIALAQGSAALLLAASVGEAVRLVEAQ